jgi:hypothetical protein
VYTQRSSYFEIIHSVSHLHKAGKLSVAGCLAWPGNATAIAAAKEPALYGICHVSFP